MSDDEYTEYTDNELKEAYRRAAERTPDGWAGEPVGGDADDTPTADAALDGLLTAANYADEIGQDDLGRHLTDCYQILGEAVPDEHCDEVAEPGEELSLPWGDEENTDPGEMGYKCQDCGDVVMDPNASGEWNCIICGGRMKKLTVIRTDERR